MQDREEGREYVVKREGGVEERLAKETVLLNSKEEFHLPKIVGVHLSQN